MKQWIEWECPQVVVTKIGIMHWLTLPTCQVGPFEPLKRQLALLGLAVRWLYSHGTITLSQLRLHMCPLVSFERSRSVRSKWDFTKWLLWDKCAASAVEDKPVWSAVWRDEWNWVSAPQDKQAGVYVECIIWDAVTHGYDWPWVPLTVHCWLHLHLHLRH